MDLRFDIEMTTGDMAALEIFVKDLCPKIAIEIGSWKGLSAWIIARHSAELYCVDTWQGSPHQKAVAAQQDILGTFRHNMKEVGLSDKVRMFCATSEQAANIIKDETADFVFIDADHAYPSVMQDINLWKPKVKPGGILCGHDAERLWKDCSPELQQTIQNKRNDDFLPDILAPGNGVHPGVTLALRDTLNDNVNILPNSSIWWIKK